MSHHRLGNMYSKVSKDNQSIVSRDQYERKNENKGYFFETRYEARWGDYTDLPPGDIFSGGSAVTNSSGISRYGMMACTQIFNTSNDPDGRYDTVFFDPTRGDIISWVGYTTDGLGGTNLLSPPGTEWVCPDFSYGGQEFTYGTDFDCTGHAIVISGKASVTLTILPLPEFSDGNSVTIGSQTYVFSSVPNPGEIDISSNTDSNIANLLHFEINTRNTEVTATYIANGTIEITAITPGVGGNSIAIDYTLSGGNITTSTPTLIGGGTEVLEVNNNNPDKLVLTFKEPHGVPQIPGTFACFFTSGSKTIRDNDLPRRGMRDHYKWEVTDSFTITTVGELSMPNLFVYDAYEEGLKTHLIVNPIILKNAGGKDLSYMCHNACFSADPQTAIVSNWC